jgi:hypothetical protein
MHAELYVFAAWAGAMIVLFAWPQQLYPTDRQLSALFQRFASAPDAVVEHQKDALSDEFYWISVRTSEGELRFWNRNRWYAWASQGTLQAANGADGLIWKDAMPNRLALWRMRRLVLRQQPGKVRRVPASHFNGSSATHDGA